MILLKAALVQEKGGLIPSFYHHGKADGQKEKSLQNIEGEGDRNY